MMSAIGTIQRAHLTAPAELRQQAQEFETPSNFRAIWRLLNSMVLFIALWGLMYYLVDVSRWLVALAACLAGVVLIRIFIIFHDCGHGVFFTSVRANYWVGFFCGLLVITPFPTTTVSGLEHLEGETVRVRAAEEDLGLFTVTGGQVTLPGPKRLISVGQPFESLAMLNDLDRGSAGGFSLTKARHLYDVRLRVWRSGPFEVGTNEPEFGSAVLPTEPQQFWPLHLPEPHSGAPLPAAFTGDLRVKRDEGGWARASALAWRTDGPFALNVLGVGLRLAGGD